MGVLWLRHATTTSSVLRLPMMPVIPLVGMISCLGLMLFFQADLDSVWFVDDDCITVLYLVCSAAESI